MPNTPIGFNLEALNGWLVPNTIAGMTVYGVNNSVISNTYINPEFDLAQSTPYPSGVFWVNAGAPRMWPIYCSCSSIGSFGIENDADDYWTVYPGWGFRLFRDTGYSSTTSRLYFNNRSTIQTFYCSNVSEAIGTEIIEGDDSGGYGNNQTSSVRVYYRGHEITMTGIS